MPREKKYASAAERQQAYRERKARELVDPDLPVRDIEAPPEPEAPSKSRSIEQILATPYDEPLTDQEEHLVRMHFGYGISERRTRAERAGVAQRLGAQTADLKNHPNVLQAMHTLSEQEQRSRERKQTYLASLKEPAKVPSP